MATLTATRAASTVAPFSGLGAGNLCVAYGHYDLSANPTAADIIQLCRLPKGAVVLFGTFRVEDIDSNATEEVDIDLGYAANGVDVADPDAFGNFDVITGDAVAGYKPVAGTIFPLDGVLSNGPLTLGAETIVQAVVNVDAATFAAGTIVAIVCYVTP
jgi:hypothetical protein